MEDRLLKEEEEVEHDVEGALKTRAMSSVFIARSSGM